MSGKRAVLALIFVLLAFGYVFTLNPGLVEFQVYPGTRLRTSLALILFLFLLSGAGVAVLGMALKEAARSYLFWRHRKGNERHELAKKLLVQSRGYALLGQTQAARKLLRRASRKNSGEPMIALEMARVELFDGRFETAERRLRALLEGDPRNAEVLSLLVELYRGRGDYEGQIATLTRWLELDPNNLIALRALRDLYRQASHWTQAARVQEKVLACCDTRSARTAERKLLTEFRFRQAQSPSEPDSRSALERLVQDAPEFSPAHEALGEHLISSGDREGAVQAWIRGYHLSAEPGLLLRAEKACADEGRNDEMLRVYRKLGRHGLPLLFRARLLLVLGRPEKALEILERDAAGAPASPLGRLLLAESLYRVRSYDDSARTFRDAVFGSDDLSLVFVCSQCGTKTRGWRGCCPSCDGLQTQSLDLGWALPPALPAT